VNDAVVLSGVGKRYLQVHDDGLLIKRLLSVGRSRRTELWALSDLTFSCRRGETLGIIGRNGSGKTTLLRLLAGVSAPTVGRLRVEGTIAPLIGVGVGFNAELTGRENVFANGQILGMSPREVRENYDAIVEFSEIEEFIDVPVKFYSSGMFLRLAFAVAIHVRPEVLLVDEVLAVGDMAFQQKCFDRMLELKEKGTTILIVTHHHHILPRMCERTIVLNRGRLAFDGPVEDALGHYHEILQADVHNQGQPQSLLDEEGRTLRYAGGATVRASLIDENDQPTRSYHQGEPIALRVEATFDRPVRGPVLGVAVSLHGVGAIYMNHFRPVDYRGEHGPLAPLEAVIRMENPLLPASYRAQAVVFDEDGEFILGQSADELFSVSGSAAAAGLVDLKSTYELYGQRIVPRSLGLAEAAARDPGD
jgi:ABC-type polysaccharide/polyol phosphate transport system ATPase subunit